MTNSSPKIIELKGRGPHVLPQITNLAVGLYESGHVTIEAETVDQETGRPDNKFVRVPLSPKDAMLLLINLQSLASDQGYEIPDTEGHIIERPGGKKGH